MVTVPCWWCRCAGNRWSVNVASHMVWARWCPGTAQTHAVVSAQFLLTDPVRQASLTVPLAPAVIKSKDNSVRYGQAPLTLFIAVNANLKTRSKWDKNTSKICKKKNNLTCLQNWLILDESIMSLNTCFKISLTPAASTVILTNAFLGKLMSQIYALTWTHCWMLSSLNQWQKREENLQKSNVLWCWTDATNASQDKRC